VVQTKSLIEKSFVGIELNIASNGSEDSKLSIEDYEHGQPEIGDWLQIDDYDSYESFQELLQADELDEFIKENEVCITSNYCGLRRSRLQEFLEERRLKV
jgi:hypothetical protein